MVNLQNKTLESIVEFTEDFFALNFLEPKDL